MPSPFPGMDPYLENSTMWSTLHHSLITYIRDALQPKLRPNYNARIEERVFVEESPQTFYPDVALLKPDLPRVHEVATLEKTATEVVVRDPAEIILFPTDYREPFIEIRHASGQVITVIEVLSPANKTGEGCRQYRRKQEKVLNSQAHLVEIDLWSQGEFTVACADPMSAEPARHPALPPSRYLICVSRATRRSRAEAYPLKLQESLPAFRIPLKAPDADVVLNLQAVFEKCYENGGYADLINYKDAPPAPLTEEEEKWVKETILKV
ncbi:MAG: DUF4058 family protein [Chloroflexota bacterium]